MRLVELGERDEDLLQGTAELINRAALAEGLGDYSETWDAEMVRLWVSGNDEGTRLIAAVTDGGAVAGYELVNGWACIMRPAVDPHRPAWLAEWVAEALTHLGTSLLRGMGCGGLVRIHAGVEGGFRHRLLKAVANPFGEEIYSYLMRLVEPVERPLPEGYVLEVVRPDKDMEALEDIVAVRNEAFAEYGWSPVEAGDLRPYYADLFRRYEKVVVALVRAGDGSPAAYVEAFAHRAVSGRLAGEVSMAAVRPGHRGRGLGSFLVSWAGRELLREAGVVYLYAVGPVGGFYHRIGFAEEARFMWLLTRPLIAAHPPPVSNTGPRTSSSP